VNKGYGATEPTANYPNNFYARGHQIPNADRSGVPDMMAQTYYSTNMTPQIQNGFNGSIWAKLEEAVRMEIPQGDTLYVVTGAVFEKYGTDEKVKTIVNKNDSKTLPVPNYYWKALMKVKRAEGKVTDASTIGFWLPHGDLKGHSYADYAVSVDQIEEWTGFNLFPSIPDVLEPSAESQISWISFQSF
jgi:endonuclease G